MKNNSMIRKIFNWQVMLGLILITLSVIFYYIHYLIFHDLHHIFIYLIGDIAFVFIEVLLVTLILHQLLGFREKKALLRKLNMVIGAFYSEVGQELMKMLSEYDTTCDRLKNTMQITSDWKPKNFSDMEHAILNYECVIDSRRWNLDAMKKFLISKRQFLLNLLENPNLLEHEDFTEMLWAVFHLTDELSHRNFPRFLPPADYDHLSGDIKRAYIKLIYEWLAYMDHLKRDYPYLFSLAMRINPFKENATAEIK
jgi:hypothetical protein